MTANNYLVEGRDGYLPLQAFLYAIARIQTLPDDRQEFSNMAEMCEIVRNQIIANPANRPFLAHILGSVESHVGHEIDLWPSGAADYTDEEIDVRDSIRAQVKALKAKFEETGLAIDAPASDVIKSLDGVA